MNKLILTLFFICPYLTFSQNSDSLIGVWQDNEVVAAGWSNTFLFFKDGKFKFFYNQMDMRKREIAFSGTWHVEEDVLNLDVKERSLLEGGRLVENEEGKKGDSILIDATSKMVLLNPPEKVEISISKIYTDTPYAMGKYIYIDAIKFYLMSRSPEELLHEFEGK
ncbi:MAG TPA: hypothetical protein VGK25_12910 [Ignavibacteria bacterium]|jgi:hypothetical protein